MTIGGDPRALGRFVTGATPTRVLSQEFVGSDIPVLRKLAAGHGLRAGLDQRRCEDLMLVVDELLSNAVRHGGGRGFLEIWAGDGWVRFQVVDAGPGIDGGATIQLPDATKTRGRGLWIVHQLSDGVTIASGPNGTNIQGVIGQQPGS